MSIYQQQSTPSVQFVNVTPELAREWLERNENNRLLRSPKIDMYAEDMRQGKWTFNGEAIKFSNSGRVIDGQHRLNAVIKSGTSIQMLVIQGLEDESQLTMDSGMKRVLSDALQFEGEANSSDLAAILNSAVAWDLGNRDVTRPRVGQRPISTMEAVDFLTKNPDVRDAVKVRRKLRGKVDAIPRVLGTLYWVFSRIDKGDADFFFDRLGSDLGHEETSPIYQARVALKNSRSHTDGIRSRGRGGKWETGIICKAWNKYRTGEGSQRLTYRPGGAKPEPFPEPI